MENVRKFLVAATLEKANTCVFAEMVIHNPKVAGSSPAPATNLSLSVSKTCIDLKAVRWRA